MLKNEIFFVNFISRENMMKNKMRQSSLKVNSRLLNSHAKTG